MAEDFVAGTLGGMAGVLVGHPADTVKVRLQSHMLDAKGQPLYRSTWGCFRTIVRDESARGLYKGLASPIVGVGLINALLFGVYGHLLRWQQPAATLDDPSYVSPLSHIFLAGVGSGFVNSFVSCPFELAKINMQNQGVPSQQQGTVYRGPVDFLRQRFRANGIAGCYRGLGATILRETPSYGIYFASYEGLCRWLTPPGTSTSDLSSMRLLLAGGIGGIMGWIWIYPVDVIKTKMQDAGRAGTGASPLRPVPYRNMWDCAVRSYREEGAWVFTRGLNATLLRAFPTNAATLMVYTLVMRMFQAREAPNHAHATTMRTHAVISSGRE